MPLNLGLEDQLAQSPRRIAYERLLLDLIDGDPTLFVRRDEVDAQREWVVAIRNGWKAHSIRPKPYGAGVWGRWSEPEVSTS